MLNMDNVPDLRIVMLYRKMSWDHRILDSNDSPQIVGIFIAAIVLASIHSCLNILPQNIKLNIHFSSRLEAVKIGMLMCVWDDRHCE